MELSLLRIYRPEGTNGEIINGEQHVCFTIELPWLNNAHKISCIPEGRYELRKRFDEKFHWHIEVCHVPERDCILMHPANNAKLELEGCIAPVTKNNGPGKGILSVNANEKMKALVFGALEKNEKVFITIKKFIQIS